MYYITGEGYAEARIGGKCLLSFKEIASSAHDVGPNSSGLSSQSSSSSSSLPMPKSECPLSENASY
jgi:hypothetical protein